MDKSSNQEIVELYTGPMAINLHTSELPYLIIGGATKAGTTSLFRYLADHPEICGASVKETRFFLDANYQLPSKYRYTDGLDKYEEYFPSSKQAKLRLEATPDYLYSAGTAERIRSSLRNVKFVFCLRDPTDRFLSWYRYAVQIGQIPAQMSLDEYLRAQRKDCNSMSVDPYLHTLEQGKYSRYLKRYIDIFGRQDIHIVWFEQLKNAPQREVETLCAFAGIDPGFYATYSFGVHNRTLHMRSPAAHRIYLALGRVLRNRLLRAYRLRRVLRAGRLLIEPLYLRFNAVHSQINVPTGIAQSASLANYYAGEKERLSYLLEEKISSHGR